ncbi:ribulose-phosphate 3-epimerase [Demequina capsici]|uniref:Ribulose-phosphate 3-epimerase n=1 Tax=Demequina capsici TaxID=3075620 RepID=A0AA96JH70_9MICO|nr:ribulose-phosphate 3-epimerase [Demequina sp. PMTSA13]WNM28694.1 ribulose-phosphate 3-epimerase [Demequina sp. PMTSA13]
MGIQIAPSILSADFANLERDIVAVSDADWLHVDVMDGHFVPNLTLGLPVLERLAEVSPLPVDAHLMIEDPDRWAPRYAEAGATSVTFHLEAAADPVRIARDLRALGARSSVALKPGTPVEHVIDVLVEFDMVLVMTVEPGFGGQAFMPETMPKVRALRDAARAAGHPLRIEVDGGIARDTVQAVVQAGADMLVAGSAIYSADDRAAAIAELRRIASQAAVG